MINNLKELQSFTEKLSRELPALTEDTLLVSPGFTKEQCAKLKESLPEIPDSYLECLKKFKLKGVSLSYFSLWPTWRGKTIDTIDEIIQVNTSEKNPLIELLRKQNLFEVATFEGDTICVSSEDSMEPGYVFWIDNCSSGPEIEIYKLCDSFEKFLLCAGNLQEMGIKYGDEDNNSEAAKREFLVILEVLKLCEEEIKSWGLIAEMSI